MHRDDRRQQHLLRHAQQHTPRLAAGGRLQRLQHRNALVIEHGKRLGLTQRRQDIARIIREHILELRAEPCRVGAIAGDQASGAQDADFSLARVESTAVVQRVLLEAFQTDIQAQHSDGLAIFNDWKGDAGD